MKLITKSLALIVGLSLLMAPFTLQAQGQGFLSTSDSTPEPTGYTDYQDYSDYSDYGYELVEPTSSENVLPVPSAVLEATDASERTAPASSSFLGTGDGLGPSEVLEVDPTYQKRQMMLATASYGLSLAGLIATIETFYGIASMNPNRTIHGAISLTGTMFSYAVVSTVLGAGLGA